MKDTGVDHNNNNVAPGYVNDTQKAAFIDAGLLYAGGALYSTTGDLYKLDQALYSDKLLPQTRLQEMFTPYVPYTLGLSYGYGWVVGPQLGYTLIGNTTARLGYSAAIERYPDQHLTVIVLSNLATNDIGIISHSLAQLFLPPA
jgi:CubicO group peptidase (beta-lactamase class C family)